MKKLNLRTWLLLIFATTLFTACDDNDDPLNIEACFTFSPEENIQVGDTVYFTNCSEEATEYSWNFGDETTSTDVDPFHIYTEPGNYNVTLIAESAGIMVEATATVSVGADLSYIINYGSYSGDKSTITTYDKYADAVENGFYKTVNGVDLTSNIQYAYEYEGNIYFMGNAADQVFWVDAKTFQQTQNAITDVVKPRYCVASGDYLYVSCWGGDVWADQTLSYIAKINLSTKSVEKKITVHGGPEGLEIVNGKLYAALNYTEAVAVVDLATDEVSTIAMPAGNIPSYFEKDDNNNLYVVLGIAYGDEITKTGIGYLNTSSDELETTYELDGVSSMTYVDIFEFNDDYSKLYVMTQQGYGQPGAVAVFDVASKSFEAENFIDNVMGINGVGFNDGKVFCFFSESTTSNGKVKTYSEDGTALNEFETGIAPFMLLTVE